MNSKSNSEAKTFEGQIPSAPLNSSIKSELLKKMLREIRRVMCKNLCKNEAISARPLMIRRKPENSAITQVNCVGFDAQRKA
jgi:hypothetical protein